MLPTSLKDKLRNKAELESAVAELAEEKVQKAKVLKTSKVGGVKKVKIKK